jgi:hypothetical protein
MKLKSPHISVGFFKIVVLMFKNANINYLLLFQTVNQPLRLCEDE